MLDFFSRYPTYQVFLTFLVSMVLTLIAMPLFIKLLRHRQIGQQIRADGPEGHLVKQGTPTMAGIVILVMMTASIFLVGTPDAKLLSVLAATLLTGLIGFADDISKVAHERSLGLLPWQKMVLLGAVSVGFCLFAVNYLDVSPSVVIPFANVRLDLGVGALVLPIGDGFSIPWLYVVFVFLLMAGMSNAVNLTDGLDGLAGGTVTIVMIVMAAIAYRSDMLDIAVFAVAAAGACVGFLWFNCHPAEIFMGDTGSLALGTALAAIAVVTDTEVFSLIIGGLFVAEACSVIIQVAVFKWKGRRVFLMAPLHHHYEKKGWSETTVVIRFWIVSALLAGAGFAVYFAGGM